MFHFISEAIIKAQLLVLEERDPSAEKILENDRKFRV